LSTSVISAIRYVCGEERVMTSTERTTVPEAKRRHDSLLPVPEEDRFLNEGWFCLEGDGHRFGPWGIFGGKEGTPGDLVMNPDTDREEYLPSKIPDRRTEAGDAVRTVSPCAYGDPLERDPRRVLDDVLDGLVSEKNAREQYGVVLDNGAVNAEATERLQAEIRASGS
jgi:N-methylhydantoinase B